VVSVDEASKGVRSLKRSGADMTPFHQLLNMKVDRRDAGDPPAVSAIAGQLRFKVVVSSRYPFDSCMAFTYRSTHIWRSHLQNQQHCFHF
jgi:hypothetical protein